MTSIIQVVKVLILSATIYVGAVPLEVVLNPNAIEDLNYRLNGDVLPSNYNIKLTPYFENVASKFPRISMKKNSILIFLTGRSKACLHLRRWGWNHFKSHKAKCWFNCSARLQPVNRFIFLQWWCQIQFQCFALQWDLQQVDNSHSIEC